MTTVEGRLGALEVRVDNLETWAGPGQVQALVEGQRELRADLTKVQQTQDRHTRMLADLISDVSGLKTDVVALKTDVTSLKTDVATLKSDVATLKSDVASLKSDVASLKSDVATLKSDVATLKSGMAEILRRLPAPPAGA